MQPQDPNQNQPVQPIQPVVGGGAPTPPIQPIAPQQPAAPIVQPMVQATVSPTATVQPTVSMQPQAQPIMPMQPVANGMAMAPVMPGSTSNKKTILTILGGVFGVIILLVVGVYLMGALGGVSQADYKKSLTVARDAAKAYSNIGAVYISTYSSEAEITSGAAKMKSGKETFDQKIDELGKTKAIKKDKKLHELFTKLETKKKPFDSAVDFAVETYTYIMPAVSNYTQNYLTSKQPLKVISTVRQKLEANQPSLKSDINIRFIKAYTAELKSLESAAKRYQASPLDYSSYNSYLTVASKIRKTTTAWSTEVSDMKDKSDIFNEFNALGRAIAAKASGTASSDSSGWIYQLPFKALTR